MKNVQIVHNPTAGDGKHKKSELVEKIGKKYQKVHYASTQDPGWEKFLEEDPELIFLGGGDGTFQKLAEVLLKAEPEKKKIPIALVPLGTANNIATTIGLEKGREQNFSTSGKAQKGFDVAHLLSAGITRPIFEGVGFGLFPRLIQEMAKNENKSNNPEEELKRSHQILLDLVKNFEPQQAQFQVEGETIRGTYLLVELMNIKLIGPNFKLAPKAELGDGHFDLVTVSAEKRDELIDYLEEVVQGNAHRRDFSRIVGSRKIKKISMKWEGKEVHLDDEPLPDYSGEFVEVEVEPDALRIFVPDNDQVRIQGE